MLVAIAHWLWHTSVYGDGKWCENIVVIKTWGKEKQMQTSEIKTPETNKMSTEILASKM